MCRVRQGSKLSSSFARPRPKCLFPPEYRRGNSGQKLFLREQPLGGQPSILADLAKSGEVYMGCEVLLAGVGEHVVSYSMLTVASQRTPCPFGGDPLV